MLQWICLIQWTLGLEWRGNIRTPWHDGKVILDFQIRTHRPIRSLELSFHFLEKVCCSQPPRAMASQKARQSGLRPKKLAAVKAVTPYSKRFVQMLWSLECAIHFKRVPLSRLVTIEALITSYIFGWCCSCPTLTLLVASFAGAARHGSAVAHTVAEHLSLSHASISSSNSTLSAASHHLKKCHQDSNWYQYTRHTVVQDGIHTPGKHKGVTKRYFFSNPWPSDIQSARTNSSCQSQMHTSKL